jgi:hypothetical protein
MKQIPNRDGLVAATCLSYGDDLVSISVPVTAFQTMRRNIPGPWLSHQRITSINIPIDLWKLIIAKNQWN